MTGPGPLYVSLGDSLVSGQGIGLCTPPEQTWTGLVARAAGARHVPLARGGAPVAAVLRDQLPVARRLRPDQALVCGGLNDLFRAGGAAGAAGAGLAVLVDALRAEGTRVLVGRLHDPTRLIRLPARLATVVRTHVERINAALDELAARPGVDLVDLAVLLDRPACWAVDRVHPSSYGHRVLAAEAAVRLGLRSVPAVPPPPASPRASTAGWLVRHGAPWLVYRLPELATSAPLRAGLGTALTARAPHLSRTKR